MAKHIHKYEHKNLIIGFLRHPIIGCFVIIRREHKDIFVKVFDPATHGYFKSEYSLSEFINLLKKKNDEQHNFRSYVPMRISNLLKK